jgi:hypothetical protein
MKLNIRDAIATVLVLAVAVPYTGYLVYGEMPFIEDPRGMSAVGLILGVAAFLVLRRGHADGRFSTVVAVLAVVSVIQGVIALALAETAAAETLLAVFMGSLAVVWAVALVDHAGLRPGSLGPAGTPRT